MYANDRSCLNTIEQAFDLAVTIEPSPGAAPALGVALDAYHVWWDPHLARDNGRAGARIDFSPFMSATGSSPRATC